MTRPDPGQPDMLLALREHDLPPRWDGRAVVWLGWEYARPIFICPPPKPDVCEGCGMPTTERGFPAWSTNYGMVADSPRLTHADYEAEEAARARLPERIQHKLERHWWKSLIAYRCHSCSLDHLEDLDTREFWRLDHTDYGPEGSVAP